MQVRQMNYLLAVVECGSFRLAAQQLFMSQPALSQSIRALEEELGFPLLERRPDGVAPTQMGEVVYRDVKGLLAAMEEKTQAWKTQYARQCAWATSRTPGTWWSGPERAWSSPTPTCACA